MKTKYKKLRVTLPERLAEDTEKLFKGKKIDKGLSIVSYIYYMHYATGFYNTKINISSKNFEKIATARYREIIDTLINNNIIKVNEKYRFIQGLKRGQKIKGREKGYCKSYAINYDYMKDPFEKRTVRVVERIKVLESEEKNVISKYVKEDIKSLVISDEIPEIIKMYAENISIDDFKTGKNVDGFDDNLNYPIKLNDKGTLKTFRLGAKDAYEQFTPRGFVITQDKQSLYISKPGWFIKNKKDHIYNSYVRSYLDAKRGIIYSKRHKTNGRLNTNITNMPNLIFDKIKKDNGLVEIDMKNSQYMFLANLMDYNNYQGQGVEEFKEAAYNGHLYEDIMEQLSLKKRSEAKIMMMLITFSSHRYVTQDKINFAKKYSGVLEFVDYMKKESGEKNKTAITLQKLESDFFIDKLWKPLKEKGLFCLTKHDSLIVKKEDYAEVVDFVREQMENYNLKGTIDIDEKVYHKNLVVS